MTIEQDNNVYEIDLNSLCQTNQNVYFIFENIKYNASDLYLIFKKAFELDNYKFTTEEKLNKYIDWQKGVINELELKVSEKDEIKNNLINFIGKL